MLTGFIKLYNNVIHMHTFANGRHKCMCSKDPEKKERKRKRSIGYTSKCDEKLCDRMLSAQSVSQAANGMSQSTINTHRLPFNIGALIDKYS